MSGASESRFPSLSMEMASRLDAVVREALPDVVALRRVFHRFPEQGWLEYGTTAVAAERLEASGFAISLGDAVTSKSCRLGVPPQAEREAAWDLAYERGVSSVWLERLRHKSTGLVAERPGRSDGPVVAIRCDIDALPLCEEARTTHRPAVEGWASECAGSMHACGHDGHLAITLGLAAVLAEMQLPVRGRVRLILQPAEEGGRGGEAVCAAGAAADVDHLICFHIGMGVPSRVVVGGAVGFLAATRFDSQIVGRAAHAGFAPEQGRSALLAAAHASLGLHSISQHSLATTRVNVGVLRAGTAANTVPDHALLSFQTRSDATAVNEELGARAESVLAGAAWMYDCEVFTEVTGRCIAANSHPELAGLVVNEASRLEGVDRIQLNRAFGASEDATFLMDAVHRAGGQATYALLGSDLTGGHHTRAFDFDESVLEVGVRLLAGLVARLTAEGSCPTSVDVR